jgi:hypothetical protein
MNNDDLEDIQRNIDFVIDEVAKKPWVDRRAEQDQFATLRRDRNFRDAQISALYEQYFLPGRHEHEWQILSDIAHTIVTSSLVEFVGLSVAGGVIGNAAFDLIKKLCSYTAQQYKKKLGYKAKERADSFQQISSDAETLKLFFTNNKKARIDEIEQKTGLPREKIYPLMKLAGLNHCRRDNACFWEIPN